MNNTTIFPFRKRSDAETLALCVETSDRDLLIADTLTALHQADSGPVADYMAFAERQASLLGSRAQAQAEAIAAVAQMAAFSTPPTNRGVERTWPAEVGGKTAFVDYLRYSVTNGRFNVEDDLVRFGGDPENWRAGNGGYCYRESWHYGGCTIYYDGRQDGMGYCVQFSGEGCRELEAGPNWTGWGLFLYGLLDFGSGSDGQGLGQAVNFTRLDIALDDKEGMLDLAEIERKTRAKEYTCRGGSDIDVSPSVRGSRKRGTTEWGTTVYFGRRTSSQLCRIYNKAVEDANKAGTEVGDHWVRVEYEAHDERAQSLANAVVSQGVAAVAGVLLDYVDFKEPTEDTNLRRGVTSMWWAEFIAFWDKVKLAVDPHIPSVEKSRTWLEKSVCTTFATVYSAQPTDVAKRVFMERFVSEGLERMKKKHHHMVSCHLAALGRDPVPV